MGIDLFYGLNTVRDIRDFRNCLSVLRRIFGRVYASDGLLAVNRNVGFLADRRFLSIVQAAAAYSEDEFLKRQAKSKLWRLHLLTWAAALAMRLPGDFVECGAFDGFSAFVVAEYTELIHTAKTLYIYDTFAGLSPKYASANELKKNIFFRQYPDVLATCRKRFSLYRNVEIIQGVVPETLVTCCPELVSFLHLDMNCADAERGALEHVLPRVVTGGLIVLDDYGRRMFRGQKDVADAIMMSHNQQVLELPTGQGLIIKAS